MAKYIVTYSESYSRDYEVEANSKRLSKKIFLKDVDQHRMNVVNQNVLQ